MSLGRFLKGRTVKQVEVYLNGFEEQGWDIIDADFQTDLTMPGGIDSLSRIGGVQTIRVI